MATKRRFFSLDKRDLFENYGIPLEAIHICDKFYNLYTERWFYESYAGKLRGYFRKLKQVDWKGKWIYVTDSNDCEDAAIGGRAFASSYNRKSAKGTTNGIPVGVFFYTSEQWGRHAILCALLRKGKYHNSKRLYFMEPILRRRLNLTIKEVESCTLCLI